MALTTADYLKLLQALLPSGRIWAPTADATLTRLLTAFAEEFAAVDLRGGELLLEADPRTATELLPEWEEFLGIVPAAGAGLAERRALVAYRLTASGDIKRPYFVALAGAMGYTIRIDDYTESQAGWQTAGAELLEEPWIYLTAGCGLAGDFLASEDVRLPWIWEVVVLAVPAALPSPTLEEVLDDLRPPHYQLNFTYLQEV